MPLDTKKIHIHKESQLQIEDVLKMTPQFVAQFIFKWLPWRLACEILFAPGYQFLLSQDGGCFNATTK